MKETERSGRQPVCPACVSERTRIVGQSGVPPIVHYRCEQCGELFSRPFRDEDDSR